MNDSIKLCKIKKSFGINPVIDDLSCSFPKGETSALLGISGRGKTTLMRILMGLEKADSGEILGLDGLRPSAVFQENRLCENLSAVSNIRLVNPSLTRGEVLREMEKVGLCGCADQSVCSLSGGMKRRVALLRAIMADWDILFLDEPFEGLDSETRKKTIAYVRSRTRGKTVLIVTHVPQELEMLGCREENTIRL